MKPAVPLAAAALALAFSATLPGNARADAEAEAVCAEARQRYENDFAGDKPTDGEIVLLYKYRFCPDQLTVKAGTTVHFLNVDKRTSHSVWFREADREESERFFPDEGWQITLNEPGTYPYLCGPHWESEGMKATLTVVP